jgi:hypothetical protein
MNQETLEQGLTAALKLLALPAITQAALYIADAAHDQQEKSVLSISVISIPVLASLAVLAGNSLGNDKFFKELSESAIESIRSGIKSIRSGIKSIRSGIGSITSEIKSAIRPGRKTMTAMTAVVCLGLLVINNEITSQHTTSECLFLSQNKRHPQPVCAIPNHTVEGMLTEVLKYCEKNKKTHY